MAGRRCRRRASLGITRDFSRLYPTVGMIAVALLTLTPLALRPVRLACLIHAANVHSEPGSNPSKCGHGPEGPLPSSKGRGYLTGRGGPDLTGSDPHAAIEPAAGFVKTAPTTPRPPRRAGGMRASRVVLRRLPSKVPRGLTEPQQIHVFSSLLFTSDRIVKEPLPPTQPAGASFQGSRHRPALGSTSGDLEWFAA